MDMREFVDSAKRMFDPDMKRAEKKKNGTILVVDDELANRLKLAAILEEEYDILFAENGRQAMDLLMHRSEEITLVILDLRMPVMGGTRVLREMKARETLRKVPVLVVTADKNSEVECLRLGAIDFLTKPYPADEVIKARVAHAIALSRDRKIIDFSKIDALTGLYKRDYFFQNAAKIDQQNPEKNMDAVVVDIHHFHVINELYGKLYGDKVLRQLGAKLTAKAKQFNGIVCRKEADSFFAYWPHRENYLHVLNDLSFGGGDDTSVHLRMGIYENVERSLDIERRFDRAQSAANKVRGTLYKAVGIYTHDMHEKEILEDKLTEEFPRALQDNQFIVYYQPKFDIQQEKPVLYGAEALVRWIHPTKGLVGPNVFIPLFEKNGLITELDRYVWRQTAAQLRAWKESYGIDFRISVNVSREDMGDPQLTGFFERLLDEYKLEHGDMVLEITESAYAGDSKRVISTVSRLREMGYLAEMDDFGTGYSSLNMLHQMPIDALKLDMQFIRDAFRPGSDTRLIQLVIEIAKYLNIPVIAEGVETYEQVSVLKDLGCDYVQGYYFSKPIPAHEFEHFLEERKKIDKQLHLKQEDERIECNV